MIEFDIVFDAGELGGAFTDLMKGVSLEKRPEIYEAWGEYIISSALPRQFKTRGRAFGEKWADLAPSTQKAYKRLKLNTTADLTRSAGGLKQSANYFVFGDKLAFGYGKEYAEYLHEGTKYMPARPLLWDEIPQEDIEAMALLVKKVMER